MPTWKLSIEYEGTRYSGWQAQSHTDRTIAGKLEQAARNFLGSVQIQGSGRTDSGVHAAGQVAHLRARKDVRDADLVWEINQQLPADIHLLSVTRVGDAFHARHDATQRIYLYQISTRRTAFSKPFVWWVRDRLDVGRMEAAAEAIVGMHDFQRWTDRRNEKEETRVVVDAAEIGTDGALILFRIRASHFLWKMVRKLVSALVEVGRHELSVEDFGNLIVRRGAPWEPTAPPSGLFLEAVLYEGDSFNRPLRAIVPVSDAEITVRDRTRVPRSERERGHRG